MSHHHVVKLKVIIIVAKVKVFLIYLKHIITTCPHLLFFKIFSYLSLLPIYPLPTYAPPPPRPLCSPSRTSTIAKLHCVLLFLFLFILFLLVCVCVHVGLFEKSCACEKVGARLRKSWKKDVEKHN
jgi:hypothetical protein